MHNLCFRTLNRSDHQYKYFGNIPHIDCSVLSARLNPWPYNTNQKENPKRYQEFRKRRSSQQIKADLCSGTGRQRASRPADISRCFGAQTLPTQAPQAFLHTYTVTDRHSRRNIRISIDTGNTALLWPGILSGTSPSQRTR